MLHQLLLSILGEMAFQASLYELTLIEVGLQLWLAPFSKVLTIVTYASWVPNNIMEIATILKTLKHALVQFMNKWPDNLMWTPMQQSIPELNVSNFSLVEDCIQLV